MSLLGQSLATESGNAFAIVNVSRRRFLQNVSAGALVLAVGLPSSAFAQEKKYGADAMPHGTVDDPRVFVAIGDDGSVRITCHRSEMGQGVRTGMPMIVADELEADWTRVRGRSGARATRGRYGNQDTDGSRSTRHFFMPMRRCGAAARMMLEHGGRSEMEGAGRRGASEEPQGRAHDHWAASWASARSRSAAAKLPVPDRRTLRLKDPTQFRYIGKPLGPVDVFDMSTGHARYGIDATLPGMRFAVIARPPVYGGKVASFDATEAMKVAGVERVLEIPGTPPPSGFDPLGGVAVIARNTWLAIQGRNALKIDWDDGPNAIVYLRCVQGADAGVGAAARTGGAQRGRRRVRSRSRGEANRRPNTTCRTSLTPRWSRRPRLLASPTANARPGPACRGRRLRANGRQASRLCRSTTSSCIVTLLGGGFGRKSKPDFVRRGRGAVAGDGRQAGQGRVDARGRPAARLLPHGRRRAAGSRRSTRWAQSSRGCIAASRRRSCRHSRRTSSTKHSASSAWG